VARHSRNLDVPKLAFLASAFCGFFLMGFVVAARKLPPYQMLKVMYEDGRAFVSQLYQTRPDLLLEREYLGEGVTRHDPRLAYDGLTFMQGLFPEGVGLRLVDMAGNIVHAWVLDFFSIWPNPTHVIPKSTRPAGAMNYHTQGMWIFADGSVVVNFAELGTVKLDGCGKILWTVDRRTHHAMTANPDGSFWIPVKGDVREIAPALLLPGISKEVIVQSHGWYEDRIMLIDRDGVILQELSVLKALIDGGFDRNLFDVMTIAPKDPTHINDIEVVTEALAARIGRVEEGDLLVSIRNLHMLVVMDRQTGWIKWSHTGPWIRQHDPDITADGQIEVFNNGGWGGTDGSNILRLDPASGETRVIYPPTDKRAFYTRIMGTHQALPNGNRLITESGAGRVFEVTPSGEVVWEYIVPYDEDYAAVIEDVRRFERGYFSVPDWSCP